MLRAIVLGAALMILSGCAHIISEESRKLVDPTITFGKLRENPDSYLAKQVMLGGIIAATRNSGEGGQIEVVQFDLDKVGAPMDNQGTGGRFLATSPLFLDPLVYRTGRLMTMVGEVKGKTTRPLEGVEYTYPTIAIREIHVLPSYEPEQPSYTRPLPSHYYDPYSYDYRPEGNYPYRPIGPPIKP
jgi:outer membrane lipoprotein